MNTRTLFSASFFATICVAPGCVTVGSSGVETADISLLGAATANSEETVIRVTLQHEGDYLIDERIDLSVTDRLVASFDGETEIMTRGTSALGEPEYRATFAATGAESTFDIALERQDGERAPASSITLPEPPEITAPEEATTISPGEGLAVHWEPLAAADSLRIQLEADCLEVVYEHVDPSAGSALLSADMIVRNEDFSGDSCDAWLTLTSSLSGEVDAALHSNSWLAGEQERSIPLVIRL